MKETFEQKLKNAARGIHMTHAEKSAMRARIFSTPSPSPYFFYSFQFTRILVPALVLVLVFGAGTVRAAQGALPGDLLYVVKITVNEGTEEVLAFSPVAKAGVSIALAARRIEEAEALAVQGRLTADLSATLEERFATHADRADLLADELEENDPESAAEVRAKLRSSLSAHGAILARLGSDSDDSEVREHSDTLATRVLAHASRKGASARGKVEVSQAVSLAVTAEVASTTLFPDFVGQKITARFEKKVREVLEDVREEFEESEAFLATSTTARVEAEIATVEELLAAGNAAGAFEAAIQLEAFIKAERKFNKHLIESLLRPLDDDEGHKDDNGKPPRIEIRL